jgi:hypothetical protein
MRRSRFLQVCSILSMLGGLVRIVFGFMMLNYFSTALSFGIGGERMIRFANLTFAVLLMSGIGELICGFKGAMNWEEPLRAKSCAAWGGGTLLLCLAGNFMQIGTGYGASFVTWTTGLLVPGLFFAAALVFALKVHKN